MNKNVTLDDIKVLAKDNLRRTAMIQVVKDIWEQNEEGTWGSRSITCWEFKKNGNEDPLQTVANASLEAAVAAVEVALNGIELVGVPYEGRIKPVFQYKPSTPKGEPYGDDER